MIYGSNIITTTNWVLTGASFAGSSLVMDAGGAAVHTIMGLPAVPDFMMLSIVASTYANAYEHDITAEIRVKVASGFTYTYLLSVVETSGGVCVIEFPVVAVDHTSITFTLRSDRAVTFTDVALFTPKLSDVDLTEILDKIPALLRDYNTMPVAAEQDETIVALISAYITETTELMGNLNINYIASESSTLILRIKDNDTQELYSPMTYQVPAGAGTLGVPHAYLYRLKGYHNFTITAQVTSGSIAIDTRRLIYAIDGGRIAYNIMDIGSIAYDISVRYLDFENSISFIYAICIDNGTCIVKKSEYTDTPGSAWVAEETIGNAIDAAIEFSGHWQQEDHGHRFYTEEQPWVAWVTPEGDLYVRQLFAASATLLASGVSSVAMVKGWESQTIPGQDQGLIVAYIIAGDVFYRNYCVQEDTTKIWEVQRALSVFTGVAVDVNAFRTNDYRIGINVLADDGTTHTHISARNWAGMAIAPELIRCEGLSDLIIELVPVVFIYVGDDTNKLSAETMAASLSDVELSTGYVGNDNAFIDTYNEGHTTVVTKIKHPMPVYYVVDFEIRDMLNYQFAVSEIVVNATNPHLLTFTVSNLAFSTEGPLTLKFLGSGSTIGFDGQSIDAFEITFTPTGIIYELQDPPVVSEVFNV